MSPKKQTTRQEPVSTARKKIEAEIEAADRDQSQFAPDISASSQQVFRTPTPQTTLRLQRTIGNQAVGRLLAGSVQRTSAASNTTTIQRVTSTRPKTRPAQAKATANVYRVGTQWHCRDASNHWLYIPQTQGWRKLKQPRVKLHNRVDFKEHLGRGAPRAASFKARKGSGARYVEGRSRKFTQGAQQEVKPQGKKKRTYRKNMQNATGYGSATQYAAANNAPVIAGGYNWCHLIGHGGGGNDAASNLVAASTHANSEHLLIERILYQYKSKGIVIDHSYQPFGGVRIAQAMRYRVLHQGKVIFERLVDGFRTAKPSGVELGAIEVQLTSALAKALDES